MIKRFLSVILAAALMAACAGCVTVNFSGNPRGVVAAKGEMKSVEFPVGDFTKVEVNVPGELIYTAEETGIVKLEIPEDLIQYISVSTENGVLYVKSETAFNVNINDKIPKLYISTPVLEEIKAEGGVTFKKSAPIITDSFKLDVSGACNGELELEVKRLDLDVSGAASLTLAGIADTAVITVAGAGDIEALDLETQDATIELAGAGQVSISCEKTLNASLSGVGTISYKGDPQINREVGGMGKIEHIS